MPSLCAFAVVFDEQSRILLCRRKKDGNWNLPGGHVDHGESPWCAVLRELREEVGSTGDIVRLAALDWIRDDEELVLTFVCHLRSEVAAPGDEIDRIDWFERAHLPAPMRDRHTERIDAALHPNAGVVLSDR